MIALIALALSLGANPEPPIDVVVVCPSCFREGMRPWVEFRREQGHHIKFVSAAGTADEIAARVRAIAEKNDVKYVVLVGDSAPDDAHAQQDDAFDRCVPPYYAPSLVLKSLTKETHIPTDNLYGDFDGDQLPDAAVGRFCVDTEQELEVLITKTMHHEKNQDFGLWRRKINIVAGVGNFGTLIDTALETGTKMILTQGIPAALEPCVTFANWKSPFCPPPSEFHDHTLNGLNEGCSYWIYIGHGHPTQLDHVHIPGGQYPIFNLPDINQLRSQHGAPVAVFFACYTGATDLRVDCLAEGLVASDGGPVAAWASSRTALPYGMTVLGAELLRTNFTMQPETLGALLVEAKRNSIQGPRDDATSQAIDGLATLISPIKAELADERREHLSLFNLLGDPLLRIQHGEQVTVQAPQRASVGDTVRVSGTSHVDGSATVELVLPPDQFKFSPPIRFDFAESEQACEEYRSTYQQANDHRLVSKQVRVKNGKFSTELVIPSGATSNCHIRVYVQGESAFATGSTAIELSPVSRTTAREKSETRRGQ